MRIICISDTHGEHEKVDVPPGDVLVFAGDMSMMGRPNEIREFAEWMGGLPHTHKIAIAGNHDLGFQNPMTRRDYIGILLAFGITYLEDFSVTIAGTKFYGSPWTPTFFNWAFMKDRGEEIKKVWDLIPDDIDVLITHGPPYNVLDLTRRGDRAGDEELRNWYLRNPQTNPRLHVFGHIHEGYGVKNDTILPTIFVNASIVDYAYDPVNKPVTIVL